jgi:antiviral helicase SKI2
LGTGNGRVVLAHASHTPYVQSFAEIMTQTECQEGIIVRCMQRLDEIVHDVHSAARVIGDTQLKEKMERVSVSLRRDIVFAASLYTQGE